VSTTLVDTGVIIRFLTGDDVVKQAASRRLFGRVRKGELAITVPHTVIADATYVLRSRHLYHLPKAEIAEMLAELLSQTGFKIHDRQSVLDALDLYGTYNKLDFTDALIIATMWRNDPSLLYSYDTDYNTFEGITRREPE
jgi:predicted nucleic acid-binding protein